MAKTQSLARQQKLYINTGTKYTIASRTSVTGTGATWTSLEHLINCSPTRTEQTQDTSDFDDAGEDSSLITSRGQTFAVTYRFFADQGDGSRPTGQAAFEALADLNGDDGVGQFKYVAFPGGPVRIFNAHVSGASGPGGGVQDIGTIAATLTKNGQFYKGVDVSA